MTEQRRQSAFRVTITRGRQQSGRCLHLSPFLLGVAAVLVAVFAVAAGLIPLHYYQSLARNAELASLKDEVDGLRRGNEEFRVAARQLDSQLSGLEITAQKLQLGAGLDTESRAIINACRPYDWIEDFPRVAESSVEVRRRVRHKWEKIIFEGV